MSVPIRSSFATSARRAAVGGVAAAIALASAVTLAGPAASAPAAAKAKPGRVGSAITLAQHNSFTGYSTDIAVDSKGTAYVGWISFATSGSKLNQVHLCVLPLGSRTCKGGVQTIPSLDAGGARDFYVVDPPGGKVTLLWYADTGTASNIVDATVTGSTLSTASVVASGPINGDLRAAVVAPNHSIWTLTDAGGGSSMQLREGLGASPVSISTPYSPVYAHIAFAHNTPIIAIDDGTSITQPPLYSYRSGSSWKSFKKVTGTWATGINFDLVATSSGVRIIAQNGTIAALNYYIPLIATWNGHGFSAPKATGDNDDVSSHDGVTDASGRLADAAAENGGIAVSNFGASNKAAIFRIPVSGTLAGFAPQIGTSPRGNGWVLYAVEEPSGSGGDLLKLQPIRLAGVHATKTAHGSHGSVTVTGPANCLPDSTISVSVKGHPKHGWKVASHHLKLGSKKVGTSINGTGLKAGKKYTLKGSVTFSSGGSHSTVTAKLKFTTCPKP
jgi:hypothetical protein